MKNTTNIHISSDFNVGQMKDTSQPKQKLEFLTLTEPFGLKAYLLTPTRITDTRNSCFDSINIYL